MDPSDSIYLDYNASTPVDSKVLEAMLPYYSNFFGNPQSRQHIHGQKAAKAVEEARQKVAAMLKVEAANIVFTGGATESINYALKGSAMLFRKHAASLSRSPLPPEEEIKSRGHIMSLSVEHPAVTETLKYLRDEGFDVTFLPVQEDGTVAVADIISNLRDDTFMISVAHANNQTGAIQPVRAIADAIRQTTGGKNKLGFPTLVHCDASQSVGKVDVSAPALGVDLLTIAGHKFYAPKGIGALYVRDGLQLPSLLHGGPHESGRRAGTDNVAYIAGLGKACELVQQNLQAYTDHQKTIGLFMTEFLKKHSPVPVKILGPVEAHRRLPNTISLCFSNVDSRAALSRISDRVCLSVGSACDLDKKTNPLLEAMKVPPCFACGNVRISCGRNTTMQEAEDGLKMLLEAVKQEIEGLPQTQPATASQTNKQSAETTAFPATERLYYADTELLEAEATLLSTQDALNRPREAGRTLIVTDQTIFHPQGGGQPSDTGYMVLADRGEKNFVAGEQGGNRNFAANTHSSNEASFLFRVVDVRADRETGAVLHYGNFYGVSSEIFRVSGNSASLDDSEPAWESMREISDEHSAMLDGAKVCFSKGSAVIQRVSRAPRMLHARLHSAGHLLDRAVSELGYGDWTPTKGYHFADGPYVEYEGFIAKEEREGLSARLTEKMSELISQAQDTKVQEVLPEDLAALGGGAGTLNTSSLLEGQPVRVVVLAGYAVPCGGTHVKNVRELGTVRVEKLKVKGKKCKLYYSVSE